MARNVTIPTPNSEINVTPMADVMLVLLIIFMITTPLLQPGITVQLPRGVNPLENPKIDSEDAVIVAITRDGKTFLGKEYLASDKLIERLRDKFAKGDKTMFIRGDTGVAYGRIVEVVELCRSAGAERIGLVTEKIKELR